MKHLCFLLTYPETLPEVKLLNINNKILDLKHNYRKLILN